MLKMNLIFILPKILFVIKIIVFMDPKNKIKKILKMQFMIQKFFLKNVIIK